MKTSHILAFVFGVTLALGVQAQTDSTQSPNERESLMLDIARFYNVRYAASTASLPRLILTDAGGRVIADGFPLDDLDVQLKALTK